MGTELKKRYGLVTAIAMVVGIVIGSGVFFKAEKILSATGGNLPLGIFSWLLGGIIMIICAYTFAVMATRYEYVNGVVDYAEATVGKRYAYYLGWFAAVIYYPTLVSTLAWVSARYTCVLLGYSIAGGECMVIACLYLVGSFVMNGLSPVLAGKFQVATTVIKLIPLFLMAIVGTVMGLRTGMMEQNFTTVVEQVSPSMGLFTAVVATAFAYEGWVIATSINAEIKDSKKNLPRALVAGSFIVVATYILYYIGLAGTVTNQTLMESGEEGARIAFSMAFTQWGGTLLFVFVVISCLGTLNGLTIGCSRGLYAIAARGEGPRADIFGEVDKHTNMPANSATMGLLFSAVWLVFFYGANVTGEWFGFFKFDSSELPIITLYAAYIPIYLMFMKKEKDLGPFKRFVMPSLAFAGSVFMIVAACFAHRMAVVAYLIIFVVIMFVGIFFEKPKEKTLPGE